MTRLALNKTELARKKRELATYRRFLPSLDLKRRQLLEERSRARADLAELERQRAALREEAGRNIPMLSNRRISVEGLVTVRDVQLGEANIVGVCVPVFESVDFTVEPYGLLSKPHWVDAVVEMLKRAAELQLREQVARERLERLEAGLKKVTQRVNLFEKVLIPRAEAAIRAIQVGLADIERASVVRSKIAKRKHAESWS